MSRLSEEEGRFKIGQIYSKLNSMLLCLTRCQSGTRTGYLSFYDPEVRTQSQLSATLSEGTDTVACSVLCTKYLCVVLYSQGISLHTLRRTFSTDSSHTPLTDDLGSEIPPRGRRASPRCVGAASALVKMSARFLLLPM